MRPWRSLSIVALSAVGGLLLFAAVISSDRSSASAQGDELATANLAKQDGTPVGVAIFTQQGVHVLVTASVNGLPGGFHGFHVHEVGNCDASTQFMSAGGHFNPGSMSHSDHAGDMPSLYVSSDGTASMSFTTDRYTVSSLFDADGSALIIHADRDNFANIPARYGVTPDATTLATGDAGARIACGVIERSGRPAAVESAPPAAHGADHEAAHGS